MLCRRHLRKCLGFPQLPGHLQKMFFDNVAEISLHPSNYIGGGPRGQRVEPPVSACKNLAPDTCGIKIRLG